MSSIREAASNYSDLGFDTLPLRQGGKEALPRGWQRLSPYRMWRKAPDNANIGIRAGGESRLAVIDCDEDKQPGTFENTKSWLTNLGYMPGEYPVVQTASGIGRHVYINLAGVLQGDSRVLLPAFGAGEFRYGPGAYVVAPPSTIEDNSYALIGGDFRQLPHLTVTDIQPILKNNDITQEAISPRIPRRAMALLNGVGTEYYPSRSEAEQAIITSLVNTGFGFEDVYSVFARYQPPKFAQLATKPEKARRWLELCYQKAKEWATTHQSEGYKAAECAITWAQSIPWGGRTGAVDRSVFTAHATIAQKAGKLIYSASCRDLAELAGINHMTASNATIRLRKSGLITLETPASADCANTYRLILPDGQTYTLPQLKNVRRCISLSSDAFRYRGLGKSAGEVYSLLLECGAMTVEEIVSNTGRGAKTVYRVLERMSKLIDSVTGEVISMVENEGDIWWGLDVDLDEVSKIVGMAGTGRRQHEKHERDRASHRKALIKGLSSHDKRKEAQ